MSKEAVAILIGAYLVGSISSAVWIGKYFFGVDVREHGSGNAGATNTFRVLGRKAGMIVFVVDMLKGLAATQLVFLFSHSIEGNSIIVVQILSGIFAVVGHIFPLYTGFRGGKGVATLLGMCLGFLTLPTLLAALVFILVFLISGYVSLGSMSAGVSFPVFVLAIFNYTALPITLFTLSIPVLLIVTHKKNIRRLIHKEENKFKVKRSR